MRVPTYLVWDRQSDEALAESRGLIRDRRKYASPDIHTDFVKIMLDGAPPLQTAAMLQPYRSCNGHGETHRGYLLQSPESLASDVMMLDAEGLTVKIHAAGDWSVRVALDAFAAARKANGNWHLLHEVAHCNMIDPLDIPRFKELNVVAECSPIHWYPTPLSEEEEKLLGRERLNRFYPIKSLIESGALVVYGSDWPFVSSGPSPWPGIEGMITRKDPSGSCPGALGEDQAVDLRTALRMVTLNGAISMYAGDSTGSIEVGKSADFIVLDRNLFEIPPEDIADIRVEMTVFKGNTVYGADGWV